MTQQLSEFQRHMQNEIQAMLIEQKRVFETEIHKLKSQITPQNNIEYMNQIQILNYELGQQKILNNTLQEKLISMENNIDEDAEKKIQLLENKKREIFEQIEILKLKYEENDNITRENEILDKRIEEKRKEIIEMISNNIYVINNTDKILILENNKMTIKEDKYIYKLDNKYEWIMGIELISYSFPETIYNITENNNSLYYYIDDIVDINITKIEIGNYTLDEILETFNEKLKACDIEIRCNKKNGIITIKSNNKRILTLDNRFNNSILGNFGYIEKEYKGQEIKSEKSYDIRSDKIMQMFINNISLEPICKIYIGSDRIYNIKVKLSNPVQEINELEIEFKDSKNRNIKFNNDFMMELSIKGICKIEEIKTETSYNENELYENISRIIEI